MLTLAIEASNPSAAGEGSGPGVAIGRLSGTAVELLGVEPLRSTRRHDDDLLPAIDRLWSCVGGGLGGKGAIELVAVSAGPGGYTGLRVAIAAGKMIAEAVGARCVAAPSAWVVARRADDSLPSPFGVALASKHESSVVAVFDAPDQPRGTGREADAEALIGLGVRGLIADRFLPDSLREACEHAGILIHEPVFDPVACLEVAARLEPVDPAALTPIYGREPEAVRKWRELHGGGA